ncbi:MFS transporter [Sphingomonas sp. HITSZ_GF]|uniref:MFS transporter n=1 Tax=Sphingomonas sp. HITSZ_GF TaxID=3037247 RepID=UPI00240D7D12|nr:MFS transporter [Sphingomonas sp. HITSZ_GF]MDG2532159.1 MFS transporter [Sphingomonas sp. HITSZ_GF]
MTALRAAPPRVWLAVGLLFLAQALSHLDRFLPSLLIKPIKAGLHLSDFEVGLLLGPAFAVFYCTMALPAGYLADRYSRRKLLAGAIAIWCMMTMLAGFADRFGLLLLSRLGVGLGEAALTPCALSLISDWFDRSRRPRAVALMMAGTTFGSALAFLGGGPLFAYISGLPPISLPVIGSVEPWQFVFLVAGPPGLLLAAAMLAVPEPPRTERIGAAIGEDAAHHVPLGTALRFMAQRWRAFLPLVLANAGSLSIGTLSLWNTALFERSFGWDVRRYGVTAGLIYLGVGLIGYPLAGWLASRQLKAGHRDGTLRVFLLGICIVVPATIFYPLAPSGGWAAAGFACFMLGQCLCGTAGPSSLTLLTSSDVRSTTTAVYFMILSLISLVIGPVPVGLLVDWLGDPAALGTAMAIETAAIGIPAILILLFGMKAFRRGVAEVEQLIAASASREPNP